MRGSLRLAVAACAAFATLAFAGSALAAYNPLLTVTALSSKPGKPTTLLLVGHFQDAAEDATAKDTIYVPLGYQMNLTQAVGTRIGTLSGEAIRRSGGTEPELSGNVVVDSPANYPPATNVCTPGQAHEAVWRLDFMLGGVPQRVPIYVDRVTMGPEALFASAKLQFCLQSPVSAPSGAQVLSLILGVEAVFTNPATTSPRIWHATFTPYLPGTATWNEAATTEGQALAPGRVSLTLTVKRLRRRVVLLQGRLLADGQPFSGATVELYTPGKVNAVGKGKTSSSGRFSIRKRLKRKTRFYAGTVPVKLLSSCPAPPIGAPQGCKTATESFVAVTANVLARPRR